MYVVAATAMNSVPLEKVYWTSTGFTNRLNDAKVFNTTTEIINDIPLLGVIRTTMNKEDFRIIEVDVVRNIRTLTEV